MKYIKYVLSLVVFIILFTSCAAVVEHAQQNEEINTSTSPAIFYDEELNVNYYTQSSDKALEIMLKIMRSMYDDDFLFYKVSGSSYRVVELTSTLEYNEETKDRIHNALIFLSTVYKEELEELGSDSNAYVMILYPDDYERIICSALNGEIDFSYLDYADEEIDYENTKN